MAGSQQMRVPDQAGFPHSPCASQRVPWRMLAEESTVTFTERRAPVAGALSASSLSSALSGKASLLQQSTTNAAADCIEPLSEGVVVVVAS